MKDCDFRTWAKAAGIRAVRTIAQTAVAMIGTTQMMYEVNWQMIISTSFLTGLVSILTSLAGLPETREYCTGKKKNI